jgi:hypothetical protein
MVRSPKNQFPAVINIIPRIGGALSFGLIISSLFDDWLTKRESLRKKKNTPLLVSIVL